MIERFDKFAIDAMTALNSNPNITWAYNDTGLEIRLLQTQTGAIYLFDNWRDVYYTLFGMLVLSNVQKELQ